MRKQLAIIGFNGYKVHCIIGIKPHERSIEQDIYIDLKVEKDISQAVSLDNVENTVDYTALAEICRDIAVEKGYFLLETYASKVLEMIIARFSVNWAWIRVRKPSAIPGADEAIIELKTTA